MSAVVIERSDDAALATIRLNRPDKRNALTLAMWGALEQACRSLERDDQVRCVVVRGAGGNFAAGADLVEFQTLRASTDQAEAYGKQMIAALSALRDCGHPTIAAVEGLCVGGGLEIALMCDLRLGAADSRYGIPIQKVGVAMPYPELAILTQMLGRPIMLTLLLEGQLHDAPWAEKHGLITRISADLETDLTATLARILAGSPVSHRHHKHFTQRAVDLLRSLDPEDVRRSYAAVDAEDYREGISAFLERRAPKFAGR